MPGCRLRYHGHDDFHGFSADRAGNCRSFFPLACKHPERIDPKRHLQEADEFLAARMEKTITSGPAKALWQHMEHEQIKKIFSGDSPCPVLLSFGMEIPEGDYSVVAFQDILLPDITSFQRPFNQPYIFQPSFTVRENEICDVRFKMI